MRYKTAARQETLPPIVINEPCDGGGCQVQYTRRRGRPGRSTPRANASARPAASEQRQSLTAQGKVRHQLKTHYADGTTHVIFESLDFISWLVALVPKPRVNLTRYHGVFAPNSQNRVLGA